MRIQLIQNLICILITSVTFNAWGVTLSEAIESAMSVDPTLRASKLNLLAAEENIAMARSRLLPQVSLQGTTSQLTQTTSQEVTGGADISRSFTGPSANHQIVIRQALFHPKDLSTINFAILQTSYLELKFKQDVKDLRLKVVNAWLDFQGAKQIADAYELPLAIMKAAYEQEKSKYEQGDGTRDVVSESEAQFINASVTHKQAIIALQAKKAVFEKLISFPAEVVIGKNFAALPIEFFTDIQKEFAWLVFKDRSLELKMNYVQEMMQLQRVEIAQSEHKPTLDLLATVNFAKNDATSTQGYKYRNQQVGIQYTFPIYAGGGIASNTKQANYAYMASLEESAASLNKVQNEFENLWAQLQGLKLRQSSMFGLYISAKEQEYAVIKAYELGVKTKAEVAAATNTLSKRLIELISMSQDYYKTISRFDFEKSY
jgi:outer membrane protein TolC